MESWRPSPTQLPLLPESHPVYEEVLRLQVPVQHVATVTESQAFEQLEEEGLGQGVERGAYSSDVGAETQLPHCRAGTVSIQEPSPLLCP